MPDELSRLIDQTLARRADDAALPRRPSQNNPLLPEPRRPERRTRPTYRDPTGNQAVGNLTPKKRKKKSP